MMSPEKPGACAWQLVFFNAWTQEHCGKARTCAALWQYFCFHRASPPFWQPAVVGRSRHFWVHHCARASLQLARAGET